MSRTKLIYKTVGITRFKNRYLRYSDLEVDKDGYVICKDVKPTPFDIIHLKIQGRFRPIPAWWDGNKWEGLRVRDHHVILAWKRNPDFV